VMRLLDGARQWGWVDVSAFSSDEKFGSPLLFVAARALFKTGKTEQARGALRRTIERFPGYDPAYALLLEMGGADTEPYLDMLAKRDRFEKRPLIWKAKLQLDAGRIEEAEKTVRTAIAIDPSDGEQGKGDRMRAYAVLGDTLDKKGVPEQAKVVRGAVQAIRLSEDADDWWKAGLLTRAVKMYEQALDHFADAYCIQSRLALRYFELGDFQNAGRHYERAFELMSESFGRIESHCFGCEGVFRGVQAQGIADRVFSRLVEQMPDKPQAHYFLGRLRQQQGRAAEAAVQFKMAVKLDPDYLSAWSRLIEVSYYASLSPEEIEAADLALLRLDPGMRHHSGAFTRMRDMRPAWDAVLAAEKTRPPISNEPIYPLTVSKIEIEDRAKSFRAAGDLFSAEKAIEMGTRSDTIDVASLRSEFAKQRILTYLTTFFFVVESR
jgi:tetratricopeptide (TPR) repeat protein